jgi:hypothetical protein
MTSGKPPVNFSGQQPTKLAAAKEGAAEPLSQADGDTTRDSHLGQLR